ncbi:MAG: class I SAM-dependent methyltransferase [Candidatus Moraniibacteriota bacterium]
MSKLVNSLIKKGYLKQMRIIDAFSEISRYEFMPKDFRLQAEANIAIPIGHGRMIPDPLTSAVMFELLDPQEGNEILDVAFGSGWTTALLAYIAGEKGRVVAVENNEELKKTGKINVEKFGYIRKGIVSFFSENEDASYMTGPVFDRILVSSIGTEKNIDELKKHLKVGGKMVVLTDNNLTYFEKKAEDEFEEEKYSSFSFMAEIKS